VEVLEKCTEKYQPLVQDIVLRLQAMETLVTKHKYLRLALSEWELTQTGRKHWKHNNVL
jgi:hypothetical protein